MLSRKVNQWEIEGNYVHVSMRVPNDQPAINFLTRMSVRPSQELYGTKETRDIFKWLLETEGTVELYFWEQRTFPTFWEHDSVEKVAKKDAKKIKESRMCGTYEAPCKWNSYSRTKMRVLMGLTVNWQLAKKIVVNWYLAQKLVVNW